MNRVVADSIRIEIISGLAQCTSDQVLLFKRMYSHSNPNRSIGLIVNCLPDSTLMRAMGQVEKTLFLNRTNGANNMASATGYQPMKSKISSKRYTKKHPTEIIRCRDINTGKYVLIKKYVFKARRVDWVDVVDCTLDHPAEYIFNGNRPLVSDINLNDVVALDQSYNINMINYYLDSGDINEYEIRDLIMLYLKKIRKNTDKKVFKTICEIFDKADKMLSRCDRRKNSNVHEADVSYSFLIKSYKKIICMAEAEVDPVKKKVKVEAGFDHGNVIVDHAMLVERAYEQMMKHMWQNGNKITFDPTAIAGGYTLYKSVVYKTK